MQQPPRGGTWVGSTFVVTKFNGMEVFPSEWLHISSFFQDLFYPVGPQTQQPPSGGTWVGSTCDRLKSMSKLYQKSVIKIYTHDRSCLDMSEADGVDGGAICKRGFIHLQFAEKLEAPEAERHLGSRILELGDRRTDHRGIFTRKHDRSCLDMSEADGVDGGAICKRGFIHLQFAAKLEAPEAERHLGSRILE
ncbi:hypothetical protein V1477_009805 [Vespula maculifrons]|uniref:Uncharacterized protein n=1 Tax=Vespula maculifrons TaxID=7453 RepID=A0ABD2CAU3_VESMC